MEELVEKSKKGDKEAFETLILSLEQELYKIAKARLINDDDVFDAIQETIIKAYKSINKIKDNRYFKTWIIRILINQSNSIYRAKEKRIKIISFEDATNNRQIGAYYSEEKIDSKLDFNFLCSELNYKDRLIIILYYIEGFTDTEIGKILKLKTNTIKTKRTRAKEKIKNILDRREHNG